MEFQRVYVYRNDSEWGGLVFINVPICDDLEFDWWGHETIVDDGSSQAWRERSKEYNPNDRAQLIVKPHENRLWSSEIELRFNKRLCILKDGVQHYCRQYFYVICCRQDLLIVRFSRGFAQMPVENFEKLLLCKTYDEFQSILVSFCKFG